MNQSSSQILGLQTSRTSPTVRKDRRQGQGGGLLTLIHQSINFSRRPESPETLAEPYLEELTITANLGDTELIITNVYIPPASCCTGGYIPSLDHLIYISLSYHFYQLADEEEPYTLSYQLQLKEGKLGQIS